MGASLFLKELMEFYRFYKTDKKERQIVFYLEDRSYYTFFEGLITELADKQKMKGCYVTSDPSDPMIYQKKENIKSFYIRHLIGFFILLLDSKLILMTMPDLQQFHIKKSVMGANHAYLFHNIGSYFHVIRHRGLFHYDTMFCVGPHQMRELRKEEELYGLAQRKLVKFGYYRLDKIHDEYKRWKGAKNADKKCQGVILIAPGWGPWEERNSMLDLCGSKLIRKLLEADFEVILRPHPMTRKKFPEFLDSLYDEFKSFKNFKSEENLSSLESFYRSDIMISDWSGVVYEYAFGTEKPVLFVDTPMKVNNPEYKKFGFEPIDQEIRNRIGCVIGLDEIDKADSIVKNIIDDKEKYRDGIIRARDELVFNFGHSSEEGAKFILDFLETKSDND